MACTTILVGREASYDGSTMIARNEDSGSGSFSPKKFIVVEPKDQGETYTSVLSHVTIPLPKNPLRYTCMPNAVAGEGIWGAAGVNSENVSMTATETITSNERVLSGDPLVVYKKAEDGEEEQIGGIGDSLHSLRKRGCASFRRITGAVRNLRDERHCLFRFGGNLVAGNHWRTPLHCQKSAGQCLCDDAKPAGHRLL